MKTTKAEHTVKIGALIKSKVKEREISIEQLSEQLHCHSSNIYSLYKRNTICTKLLWQLSVILKFDFFTEIYGESLKNVLQTSRDQGRTIIVVTSEMVSIERDNGMVSKDEYRKVVEA